MALASRMRTARTIIFAGMLASVAACQTASVDDLVPLSGTRNTGVYPDLNVKQVAETEQLTTSEADQQTAELKAALAAQSAAGRGTGATNQSQIRQAVKRQQEVLKDIENGD